MRWTLHMEKLSIARNLATWQSVSPPLALTWIDQPRGKGLNMWQMLHCATRYCTTASMPRAHISGISIFFCVKYAWAKEFKRCGMPWTIISRSYVFHGRITSEKGLFGWAWIHKFLSWAPRILSWAPTSGLSFNLFRHIVSFVESESASAIVWQACRSYS